MRRLWFATPAVGLLGLAIWGLQSRTQSLQIDTASPDNVAQTQPALPSLILNSPPIKKAPPFQGMGLQSRWDYSDLVCTGKATSPKHTGRTRQIGGVDRDQLSSVVTMERCFKGAAPAQPIRVIGYSVVAVSATNVGGFVYSGPPPGFLEEGRNLLFLRRTTRPDVWDVTVPVYQVCIPLGPTPADLTESGSSENIRRLLAKEMEGAINTHPADAFAYLSNILEILGQPRGLAGLKNLARGADLELRRRIALTLLWNHDSQGEAETIALLLDSRAASWQRANAASALRNARSLDARQALEKVANTPNPEDVRTATRESLAYLSTHPRP